MKAKVQLWHRFQVKPCSHSRGSVLVLTLLLTGVLAISIAAMLTSVRHLTRSADDKIAEEECYFAAMAGMNAVKSWLMQPALATSQCGTAVGDAFADLKEGAESLSSIVILNARNPGWFDDKDAAYIKRDHFGDVGTAIDGGRRYVLWTWGGPSSSTKPLVIRRGEANDGSPDGVLFNTTLSGDGSAGSEARSWVDTIRITTPYRGVVTGQIPPDNLRQVSLIIEVVAKTAGAGVLKERILSGRVLIIPPNVTTPPAYSGAAIVAGGGLTISGNSNYDVHWGAVFAKNNLTVLGMTYDHLTNKLTFSNSETNENVGKYSGVGTMDGLPPSQLEKWVRFYSGGQLQNKQGNAIFKSGTQAQFQNKINNVLVTDFMAQLYTGAFNTNLPTGQKPYTFVDVAGQEDNFLTLENLSPTTLNTADGIYYDTPKSDAPTTETWTDGKRGSFVQMSDYAKAQVDASFDSLDYATWKNFAIKMKGYVRQSGGYFYNASGQKLYVNSSTKTLTTVSSGSNVPFTDLKQISMKHLLPNSGDTTYIPDRMLFVDNPEGAENSATKASVKITAEDQFFWKGMIFVSGDLEMAGSGSTPKVLGKNPDDWKNNTSGRLIERCLVDGIVRVTGSISKSGNPSMYGSMVAGKKDSANTFQAGGTPSIYYNQRCKEGIFKPTGSPLTPAVVSGPILELRQLSS